MISLSVHFMLKPTLSPSDIGHLVRAARKAQGLRQDELAGAAGVGLRFIVELEKGKPTTQLGKVLKVLDILGFTLSLTPPPVPSPKGGGA